MGTQKTFDKQTATFLGVLAQNVPQLSGDEMQFYIENPTRLKGRLNTLHLTITDFINQFFPRLSGFLKFIPLHPAWDFLIMRSSDYPELGIAVSHRSGSLGSGFCLMLRGNKFINPCGCCSWIQGVEPAEAELLIRKACADNGIRFLLFRDWVQPRCTKDRKGLGQDVGGLHFIDPLEPSQMAPIDKNRFLKAYGEFACLRSSAEEDKTPLPLSVLFENRK